MGNFCFTLACDLREDTPQQVVDTLKYMTRTDEYEFGNPPQEAFFEGDHWRTLLICDNRRGPSQFPGVPGAFLHRVCRNENMYRDTVSFRCEGGDDAISYYIEFIEWLAPYSATIGFVGHFIYETLENPTLVFFRAGHVYVSEQPKYPHEIRTGEAW